jgi:cytochrome c oxidase subunit 2
VFDRQVFLSNGQTIKADEAYIRESIVNPQAKLVSGFGPIMPTFQGQVSEEQLLQILAFIKSLQIQTPVPATSGAAPAAASPTRSPGSGGR